jgi:hypothetical protein
VGIFGSRRQEVTGKWENFIMNSLKLIFIRYYRIIKSRMRWVVHVAYAKRMRNVHKILIAKTEGNRSVRGLRRK